MPRVGCFVSPFVTDSGSMSLMHGNATRLRERARAMSSLRSTSPPNQAMQLTASKLAVHVLQCLPSTFWLRGTSHRARRS